MDTNNNKLWIIDDVAAYCRVKPSVVKYWLYNTDIPYIKLGKFFRFDQADIKLWIKERKSGKCNSDNNDDLRTIT